MYESVTGSVTFGITLQNSEMLVAKVAVRLSTLQRLPTESTYKAGLPSNEICGIRDPRSYVTWVGIA
jgi:hypothetical protein